MNLINKTILLVSNGPSAFSAAQILIVIKFVVKILMVIKRDSRSLKWLNFGNTTRLGLAIGIASTQAPKSYRFIQLLRRNCSGSCTKASTSKNSKECPDAFGFQDGGWRLFATVFTCSFQYRFTGTLIVLKRLKQWEMSETRSWPK